MRAHLDSILLVSLAITGCGGEAKKAIEQRRMPVAAKLAAVTAIAAKARALPPTKEATLTLGTTPLVMALNTTSPLRTGTLVYEQDLDDLSVLKDQAPHYTMRIGRATLLNDCGQLLAKGTYGQQSAPNVHVNVAVEYLDACANLAYVFVLRTQEQKARAFTGDLVAFELASGKHLGGFPIAITSEGRRDTVSNTTTSVSTRHVGTRARTTVTKTTSTSTVDADRDQLASDLADAVQEGIQKLVPAVAWLD